MPTPTFRFWLAPLAGLSLLAATSCKQDSTTDGTSTLLAFNDYEAVVGWVPNPSPSVTSERAHSGHYCVKVGPQDEFGMGYAMVLEKIIDHRPRKLRVEAWGFMTDANATAKIGFQLFNAAQDKVLFSDGIEYADAIKTPGKWVKISKDITLPADVAGNQQIRVFLWRSVAGSPAYVDDLKISEVQ
ncbi:hypothetical protein A0257_12975 [Hymenobacter psoromatis]|nr:hypothetical protein A0257_12975 [Hymenobacter psoromatis]